MSDADKFADMILDTIDPACTVEHDIYGDDRARNEKFAELVRAAWAHKEARQATTGEKQ